MIPTHQAARYMERATLIAACAVAIAGVIGYRLLRRRAQRLAHRIACAWMQCDEARG
jgi:biopolymer transport protein ExbB/TolQ